MRLSSQEPEACGQSMRDWADGFVLHSSEPCHMQSLPIFAPKAWLICPCSCRWLLQTRVGGDRVPRKSSSLKISCPFLG